MSVLGFRKWNDTIIPPVEGAVKVTINSEEIVEDIASISHYITDTSFNVDEVNIRITKVLFGVYQSYLSENRSDVIYYYLEASFNGETQSMWVPVYWDNEWHLTFNGVTLPNILNFTGVFITEDAPEDSKAEAESNKWSYLLQNTTAANTLKMILKAGTYRFNDTINLEIGGNLAGQYFDFVCSITETVDGQTVYAQFDGRNLSTNAHTNPPSMKYFGSFKVYVNGVLNEDIASIYINPYEDGTWNEYPWMQTMSIPIDTEVSDTFGTWYISNTNYNEVNAKPLVEITYNGETIAQLNARETATLSCEGKKMASDVVVKVNEVESKIPEGYIKPEGSLPITENGTYPVTDKEEVVVNVPIPDGYIKPEGTLELVFNNIEAEFPIDCSQYAKVVVNTAEPLKITDPTVLDNITDSPYGVGGSVFLYEGATTDSYEKGALYYLEDTDK